MLLKPRYPHLTAGHPLAKGLVGAWPFHEGGGNRVNDLSGRGNSGTAANSLSWVVGPNGRALSFDGSSQYVDTGNASPLNAGGTNFSLCAWINRTTTGGNTDQIIANDKDTGTRQFSFNLGGSAFHLGNLILEIAGGASPTIGNSTLNNNQWYFVCATFDTAAQTGIVYLNGKADCSPTSSAIGIPSSTNNITIGARLYSGFQDYFHGYIDGPLIYTRALSPGEIAQLYRDSFTIYRTQWRRRLNSAAAAASFTYFDLTQPDAANVLRKPEMVAY